MSNRIRTRKQAATAREAAIERAERRARTAYLATVGTYGPPDAEAIWPQYWMRASVRSISNPEDTFKEVFMDGWRMRGEST